MLKETLTKENLHTFLANSQRITTRAVRLAEEQNPDKYDREVMGALMKAAGYSYEDLIHYLQNYPKVFDFEENIKKLKVLDSLSNVLGSKYANLDITDFKDYKALSGFVKKYFENYSNEYEGKLNFYVKEQVEEGMKTATVLVCESIDLISSEDEPSKTHYIPLYIPDSGLTFSLDTIIDNIKRAFIDYKEIENSKTTHVIKQVLQIVEDRKYDANSFMGIIKADMNFKNEVFLNYLELSFEDKITIKPTYYVGNMHDSAGYYFINGLEYVKDYNLSYHEENEALFNYLLAVLESMNLLDNVVVSTNITKINEIREAIVDLDEDDLSNYLSKYTDYIMNIEHVIYENISKGLAKSLKNAQNQIEITRPAWNSIKKSSLKKKWESIGENLYTREIQI